MTQTYKTYQKTLKQSFSKIPLIFQDNHYLPTEDIYIELALSDYSDAYQRQMDSISQKNFDNLPIVLQEKKLAKEIRKLPMETLLKGGEKPSGYLVLGDPGSGKSTLLKTIAYRSAIGQAKYPKYLFHIELKKFIDEVVRFEHLEQINVITEYISRYQLHQERDIFTPELFDERPYFLIDGWDEIAGSEIVSVVQDAIGKTLQIGHVIVTSRRAGRLGGFNGFTFFEIVELSSRSIRNYILNFAKAQHIDAIATREELLGSILGSESLLKMAQNPFLLSLICYLKSKELFSDTSFQIRNRVELYAMAMEEIRREFSYKFSRDFTKREQRVLEGFAFWLFNPQGKTKHIFSADNFLEYKRDVTLLNQVFLPSKVLDVFRDTREIFFIHLTFQEFLVAMRLAYLSYGENCKVIREVFDKPSWREVLRFYAGVLHSDFKPADAREKFDYLLAFAWSHRDSLGLVESEIAYWFIEAGIQNPYPPFDGLKASLWERFARGKQCAEHIFEPILKAWRDEEDIVKIVRELQKPRLNLKLLQYIPFVATSSNILHQKKILDIMLDSTTTPAYKKSIASSLGQANRVELIESYCQRINQMESEQIIGLLRLISYTQDSEYYPFIEPLLIYGDSQIKDEAYETVIKIQAEPFLQNIDTFFRRYIENAYEEKFSILYYWEDEKIVRLLNGYALDENISIKMRVKIMEVMYENMYRESIAFLDRNDYRKLLQTATEPKLKQSAIMMYSALLSVTPIERLREEFELIKQAESSILLIATDKQEDFELRLASLQALKANRLRGITLFQIYMPLSELIFDNDEEVELRNGALEVMCEQAYYFKSLGIVEEIFNRGLKEFSGDMLINILFFIGQYGYSQYIKELRALAKSADSPYIQGIAIQSLGDLKDEESLDFIFTQFKTQKEKYVREITVESILKLEPKILLPYQEDEFVYSQLCRYVVERGEVLREQAIVIEEKDVRSSRDVFISHASEDKVTIVEPLVETLETNGISCWYDKKDIGWGDSIVGKINEGLETSKYVVFIISRTFLAKEWTNIELNSTLNMQISSGQKKVLPVIVGDIQPQELPPLLRDKKYIAWSHQQEIVEELKKILNMPHHNNQVDTNSLFSQYESSSRLNLSILYFYDINYDSNNHKLERIRDSLIQKIKEQNINIDLIVFSGNLVKNVSKNSLKEAYEFFIEPLLKELNIDKNSVCFTIGSQDIDLNKRNKLLFSGLKSELIDKKDKHMIKDFIENKNNDYNLYEFSNYINFINSLHQNSTTENTQLYTVQKKIVGDIEIGIVSLNSNLFLMKKESKDMWLPKDVFTSINKKLGDSSIKILNIYYPFDWFSNYYEIEEEILDKFNIVFYANKNSTDNVKLIADYNNRDIVVLESPSINNKKQKSRYSLFSYDIGLSEINITNTIYNKQGFFESIEPKLMQDIDLTKKSKKTIRNKLICNKLFEKVSANINKLLTINLTSYNHKKNIEEIFIEPRIIEQKEEQSSQTELATIDFSADVFYSNQKKKQKEKFFTIQNIIELNSNILLMGENNSGKTTLLNYINIQLLKKYSLYIPIYIDGYTLKNATIRQFESKISDYFDIYFVDKNNFNIKQMIKEKRFLFLLDNIKEIDKKLLNEIVQLENRIIATIIKKSYDNIENLFQEIGKSENEKAIFKKFTIQSFQKKDCYSLTRNIVSIEISEKVSRYVYKTIMDMKLPFNPFIATLLSWMYMEKIEIKESEPALIEVFLDYILEKSELSKKFQGKFDFSDKIDLLSEIAYEFYLLKSSAVKESIILENILKYINKFELDINSFELLEYFYDRKIFIKNKSLTMFSYRVFYFYFISKYMESNQNFRKTLVSNKLEILNMEDEFRYYASIKRDDKESMQNIQTYIKNNKFHKIITEELKGINYKFVRTHNKKSIEILRVDSDDEKVQTIETKEYTDVRDSVDNDISNIMNKRHITYNEEIEQSSGNVSYKVEYFILNQILSEFVKKIKLNSEEKEKYFLFVIDNFAKLLKYWKLKFKDKKLTKRFIFHAVLKRNLNDNRLNLMEKIEKHFDELSKFIEQQLMFILFKNGMNALATPKLIKLYRKKFREEEDSYKYLFYCLILITVDEENMIETINDFISHNNDNNLFEILFFELLRSYQEQNHSENRKAEIKKILKYLLVVQRFGKNTHKKIQGHFNRELDDKLDEYLLLSNIVL